jgi:hypothetical protein
VIEWSEIHLTNHSTGRADSVLFIILPLAFDEQPSKPTAVTKRSVANRFILISIRWQKASA